VIVDNLLNPRVVLNPSDGKLVADIFRYSYINRDGEPVPAGQTPDGDMYGTISMIRIRLTVDLNPASAPQPMDVSTTVHLRNQSLN